MTAGKNSLIFEGLQIVTLCLVWYGKWNYENWFGKFDYERMI